MSWALKKKSPSNFSRRGWDESAYGEKKHLHPHNRHIRRLLNETPDYVSIKIMQAPVKELEPVHYADRNDGRTRCVYESAVISGTVEYCSPSEPVVRIGNYGLDFYIRILNPDCRAGHLMGSEISVKLLGYASNDAQPGIMPE